MRDPSYLIDPDEEERDEYSAEYESWCDERSLDPESDRAEQMYQAWMDDWADPPARYDTLQEKLDDQYDRDEWV
ncbi:MAG: hypothetical protein ACXVGB_00110 [Mycobacteriaceae bacterium]